MLLLIWIIWLKFANPKLAEFRIKYVEANFEFLLFSFHHIVPGIFDSELMDTQIPSLQFIASETVRFHQSHRAGRAMLCQVSYIHCYVGHIGWLYYVLLCLCNCSN